MNPADGNLYAFSTTDGLENHLFRVESGGGATDLGVVSGLPSENSFGAAFDAAGTLWLAQNGDNALYGIDVAALTATRLPLSLSVVGDLAYIDGAMYAGRPGSLGRIDLSTGTVTQSAPITGWTFPAGAALWALDGHLYTVAMGGIAEVLDYPGSNPTLQQVAPVLPTSAIAGTACAPAGNPFLNAEADDLSAATVYAGAGGSAGNVFANDSLNGGAFAPAAVTASIVNEGGLAGVSIAADGTLSVPASATAGTYDIGYRICETATGRTGVCDTTIATVVVRALPVVDAVDDDFTAITAGTASTAGNVLANDTVDARSIADGDVTITATDDGGLSGVIVSATGELAVPAAATPGTYMVTYEICATVAPIACDTATASVRVVAAEIPTDPTAPTDPTEPTAPATPGGGGTNGTPSDDGLASTGADTAAIGVATVVAAAFALTGTALLWRRRRVMD